MARGRISLTFATFRTPPSLPAGETYRTSHLSVNARNRQKRRGGQADGNEGRSESGPGGLARHAYPTRPSWLHAGRDPDRRGDPRDPGGDRDPAFHQCERGGEA